MVANFLAKKVQREYSMDNLIGNVLLQEEVFLCDLKFPLRDFFARFLLRGFAVKKSTSLDIPFLLVDSYAQYQLSHVFLWS
jgi:hypothetical protein